MPKIKAIFKFLQMQENIHIERQLNIRYLDKFIN